MTSRENDLYYIFYYKLLPLSIKAAHIEGWSGDGQAVQVYILNLPRVDLFLIFDLFISHRHERTAKTTGQARIIGKDFKNYY